MTSFYSIICFDPNGGTLFTIIKYHLYTWTSKNITYISGTIYPLQMHPTFFYIIIIIVSFIAFFSFIFYSIFVTYKKNSSIYDEILPNIHKYNFIPFICIFSLFLIGEIYQYSVSRWERRNILGFFFDIIGIASTLFIYFNYKLNSILNMKYIYFLIKSTYSCILSLEWYYFCYIISNLSILYLAEEYYFSIIKVLGVILPLIYGIGSSIFSFIFKDVMACLLSSLVNIGCSIYFFKIDKIYRKQYNEFIDVANLGAIVTKAISVNPGEGNKHNRITETKSGMINSIGLENVGIKAFLSDKLPVLTKNNISYVMNVAGSTLEEYVEMAWICEENHIPAIELNVSCPNVKAGCLEFGTDENSLFDFKTKERNELDAKIGKLDESITAFIDTKVHPDSREEIKDLFYNYTMAMTRYQDKGRLLLYRAGFIDGVNSIMIPLSNK